MHMGDGKSGDIGNGVAIGELLLNDCFLECDRGFGWD